MIQRRWRNRGTCRTLFCNGICLHMKMLF
jgi:hypothetical protein